MHDALTFGQWLQRRRLAIHLTQKQLGRLAGCAPDTIRKLEADLRRPSIDIARTLAVALRILTGRTQRLPALCSRYA